MAKHTFIFECIKHHDGLEELEGCVVDTVKVVSDREDFAFANGIANSLLQTSRDLFNEVRIYGKRKTDLYQIASVN